MSPASSCVVGTPFETSQERIDLASTNLDQLVVNLMQPFLYPSAPPFSMRCGQSLRHVARAAMSDLSFLMHQPVKLSMR